MRTISNITLGCCSQYNRQLQIIVNNPKKKKLPGSGDQLKSCLSALPIPESLPPRIVKEIKMEITRFINENYG
ncbi:MAG: hypothetical protein ACK4YL_18480 [Microcystis sp.]|uniref:Uncharacterized protein n=1 Tax=Microcystis flos-aquae Mf_QC_C_20070823_S10D TaxID=2486236 RepID=A0A552KFD6_9CHRO|nr:MULTISPECIES: hypothetical protein [Microcystis]MCA2818118.1 hypothetical protein [Microcystis sp. M085S1]MCA2854361.1 hypothetical protein [Microcystis sp. M065S1]MCZ8057245.1 hypothetical protein [Microcystis sp. LE19-12.2C]MDJ0550193.1 hypothetical protein [Microcystis sp. M49637_WE12]TRU01750.1 MAG: hypothetical protein EWV65_03850 [Microcystis flos-aquae Ma_QC_C_20070823_S18D]TRV06707.1 MAG: hypothetical protein EWV45_21605 [Microcystis flos-aquae Mf_QC_C_20070823_S10D]TRV20422.1 MAG